MSRDAHFVADGNANAEAGERFTVGVDFGTLSGRAVVVRVSDGAELGSAVHEYRHGVMDERLAASGELLPPEYALQVPSDYVDVLKFAVPKAVAAASVPADSVIGIGTDFTACTVLPTTDDGIPVCKLDEYRDRPHAYVAVRRVRVRPRLLRPGWQRRHEAAEADPT
jgi:L-ribulokinase